jgi:hypothetical protein
MSSSCRPIAPRRRTTPALQQLGVETWHAPFAGRAPAWFRAHGRRFDTIVLCRHYVASEFLPLARRHAPQARIVFDTVDLHYLRERRGADLANDARSRCAPPNARARANSTSSHAATRRSWSAMSNARCSPRTRPRRASNPVEPAPRRRPRPAVRATPRPGVRRRLPPSAERGCGALVRRTRVPARACAPARRAFHCIGGHVPDEIRALGAIDGVNVHGHVPDIDPYMDGARIALAPLRYGAGVKGKVNLSMAHGQPVVATSCAVEGMHLRDGRRRAGRRRPTASPTRSCACTKTKRCGRACAMRACATSKRISRSTRGATWCAACCSGGLRRDGLAARPPRACVRRNRPGLPRFGSSARAASPRVAPIPTSPAPRRSSPTAIQRAASRVRACRQRAAASPSCSRASRHALRTHSRLARNASSKHRCAAGSRRASARFTLGSLGASARARRRWS